MRKNKTKKVNLTKTPKNPEVRYRRALNALVRNLRMETAAMLVPVLKALEPEYVTDAYTKTLSDVFDNMRALFAGTGTNANIVSNAFVTGANQANKARFYRAMENVVGVDLGTIIQNEGLEDVLVATTRENVALIRTIPEEYFKKLETTVFTGTTQGRNASSMLKEIQRIGKVTEKRAKLIARDQTSKLNSALNQHRATNLGSEEYVWRTAQDDRVRDSHRTKNGKTFRWDNPPKDTGHPGEDIQCRCIAQPIIKV